MGDHRIEHRRTSNTFDYDCCFTDDLREDHLGELNRLQAAIIWIRAGRRSRFLRLLNRVHAAEGRTDCDCNGCRDRAVML